VKTTLLVLLLTCVGLWAQTPLNPGAPTTPGAVPEAPAPDAKGAVKANLPGVPNPAVDPAVAGPGALPVPRSSPRPVRPLPGASGSNAPVVPGATTVAPGAGATPAPGAAPGPATTPAPGTGSGEQFIAINPLSTNTNVSADDMLPAGTINFPATDLNQVLKIYAELVGRTVLRPTTLPAPTITLITQTPLSRREAIQAFDAVLALNGIAVINVGEKFCKVVPSPQAGQVGAPFSQQPVQQLPDLGQYVTHVIQVTNIKPSDAVQALTPFASPGLANGILPIETSQMLVLRDYSENVKRMLEMVRKIDVTVPSEYVSEVIPIKYALASEIANALNSLSTGGGGTTVGGGTGGTTAGGGMRSGYGGGMRSGYGGYGGSSYGGYGGSGYGGYGGTRSSYGGYGGVTPYATAATPVGTPGDPGSFTDRLQRIIQKASTTGEIQVLGQTKIIADERTNSLLVFATRPDMETIKKIVGQLDVVLAQVLIEAAVIEVALNNHKELAFSYLQKTPSTAGNYYSGIGAINNNNILNRGNFLLPGATNLAGLSGGFSYLASFGNDLDVSISALASDSKARILQRPRIQTSHAVPASIFVGESRPYPSGSYYGGGAYGSYASIQQLPIGVSLEVTPLINPDGLVVMDIHQRIDSFKGNVTVQGVGDVPVTSQKEATAKVAVRDHDTIMLGGLIENSKTSDNSGVPFLKDIPLLGFLFRKTSADATRSELIVLIRPTVLPTPEVAALSAKAETSRMPEIKQMQAETEAAIADRMKKVDKELKGKP
jgi:general secretion pathway protein D